MVNEVVHRAAVQQGFFNRGSFRTYSKRDVYFLYVMIQAIRFLCSSPGRRGWAVQKSSCPMNTLFRTLSWMLSFNPFSSTTSWLTFFSSISSWVVATSVVAVAAIGWVM